MFTNNKAVRIGGRKKVFLIHWAVKSKWNQGRRIEGLAGDRRLWAEKK